MSENYISQLKTEKNTGFVRVYSCMHVHVLIILRSKRFLDNCILSAAPRQCWFITFTSNCLINNVYMRRIPASLVGEGVFCLYSIRLAAIASFVQYIFTYKYHIKMCSFDVIRRCPSSISYLIQTVCMAADNGNSRKNNQLYFCIRLLEHTLLNFIS